MTLQRFMTLLLLVVSGCLGYYLYSVYYAKHYEQIEPDAENPLFAGENVKSTSYDADGKRSYSIKSTSLEYYSKLGETHFNEPVVWTFKDGANEEWRISANFAVLRDKNIIEMKGRVRIFNLLPESSIKTISTETLTLDVSSQDFWTDSDIEIIGEGFQSSAQRANGNFGAYKMNLKGTVKSRYEPNILSGL